ncbi:xanthine dehydrogenase family protein molybdopterin-binding subunit [Alicyclobacillus cycloheptanicus]|uniref:CO/xanthine dehydrogenase Mo-binding subunit n=1 Tax=Alicyclobacillus cycloheptanicus TaxID=1457 RepID=A0ABT9XFI0_9BACL|nr:xanthine dehydrogenase family protein molybdopterin-binding subunit [Alicyclobacillus cycloheptanicus]MDQ0189056.1 CO/xanthine dehydrogenase Mo-binding subunit [Alicyclobacillus cycloheptanicus]WDM00192.1 xanthine dehydrogenase family protein molybdopterin-binding subunit [Alicyclobacillus cycloheptanicus]
MSQVLEPSRPVTEEKTGQVGRAVKRLESQAKVTGRAEYIHNLEVPGMLHAKVVRSTVAHARIVRVDVSAAKAMPGVYEVVTGQDILRLIPDPYYGPAFHDQPILAIDKVRHVGEPVAVVLAADVHIADRATDLVEVEYEELEPVFHEVESAKTTTAIVHDVIRPAGTFADLKSLKPREKTNVAMEYHLRNGDMEAAFQKADHVFEHTFRSQQVNHLPLEPIVTVARVTDTGNLLIETASQSPSFVRIEVARLMGWPENKVRVRTAFLGGGFGAKLYIKLEALVAALALIVQRPVRLSLTMEEQFYTITRHAATVTIRTGVTNDGKIVARDCKTWWNGGAYADIGPRVTQKSGFTAAGPYDIEAVSLDSYAVYTNLPPAGALRGFGIPQLVWAYESQADIIARALGMDPLEFRRKNLLRNGRPHATGTIMTDVGTHEVLEELARKMNWDADFDHGSGTIRRGRGIAIGIKAAVSPTTSVAFVNLYSDGSCGLYCGTVDMGQGSDTAMAQIVADVLGLHAEDVRVIHPDTDVTPYDMATLGSRSTFHMGNAVRLAAEDARRQALELCAAQTGHPPETLTVKAGGVQTPDGSFYTYGELLANRFGMQAGNILGVGSYFPSYKKPDPQTGMSEQITPFWMVGGTGVELEVDTETGKVNITRLVTVGDCGKAINPGIVKRQLSGAAFMQMGFTLFEGMVFDEGQVVNASFADYKIPGFWDLPETSEVSIVEVPHTNGPFGAKGTGETGSLSLSPAVANAVEDAIGVRIYETPLTPERILRALKEKQGIVWEEE